MKKKFSTTFQTSTDGFICCWFQVFLKIDRSWRRRKLENRKQRSCGNIALWWRDSNKVMTTMVIRSLDCIHSFEASVKAAWLFIVSLHSQPAIFVDLQLLGCRLKGGLFEFPALEVIEDRTYHSSVCEWPNVRYEPCNKNNNNARSQR